MDSPVGSEQKRSEESGPHAGSSKPPNAFIRTMRTIYYPLGFKKGYNFVLYFIFAGALLGFTLARLSYLNISGGAESSFEKSAAPGEWYWYSESYYRVGITLHLATVLPAGLLIPLQFTPVIRYKALLFHCLNGYTILLLILIGNIGALMIARRAFGGAIATQAALGTIAIMVTVSATLAVYNIKMLQIEQHRAWMLRAMFYLCTIITLRLIMVISATITSKVNDYWGTMPCDEILFILKGNVTSLLEKYPTCNSANDVARAGIPAVVKLDISSKNVEEIGMALEGSFGMGAWLALLLHAVGVEIYLSLTKGETERLRNVSYEKQLEAGFKNPGSAGTTGDRFGDEDAWVTTQKRKEIMKI